MSECLLLRNCLIRSSDDAFQGTPICQDVLVTLPLRNAEEEILPNTGVIARIGADLKCQQDVRITAEIDLGGRFHLGPALHDNHAHPVCSMHLASAVDLSPYDLTKAIQVMEHAIASQPASSLHDCQRFASSPGSVLIVVLVSLLIRNWKVNGSLEHALSKLKESKILMSAAWIITSVDLHSAIAYGIGPKHELWSAYADHYESYQKEFTSLEAYKNRKDVSISPVNFSTKPKYVEEWQCFALYAGLLRYFAQRSIRTENGFTLRKWMADKARLGSSGATNLEFNSSLHDWLDYNAKVQLEHRKPGPSNLWEVKNPLEHTLCVYPPYLDKFILEKHKYKRPLGRNLHGPVFKLLADGAFGSGTFDQLQFAGNELESRMLKAFDNGLRLVIHGIGGLAVKSIVRAMRQVFTQNKYWHKLGEYSRLLAEIRQNPSAQERKKLVRRLEYSKMQESQNKSMDWLHAVYFFQDQLVVGSIEHVQKLDDETMRLMAPWHDSEMDFNPAIIASIQPLHAPDDHNGMLCARHPGKDDYWAKNIEVEGRCLRTLQDETYPYARMYQAGVVIRLGSDEPVSEGHLPKQMNCLRNGLTNFMPDLYQNRKVPAALAHKSSTWNGHNSLDVGDAAHLAAFRYDLSSDEEPPADPHDLESMLTLVNGSITYIDESLDIRISL